MRFGLKSLLVLMALLAIAAAVYMSNRRRSPAPYYSGHLDSASLTLDLVRQLDPNVKAGGGGGGGGSSSGQARWYVYKLTSTHPINESYFESIRKGLLEDLSRHGVRVTMERTLHIPDREPNQDGLLRSWGFEVLVEDQGFKGLITFRLMPTPGAGAESSGHQGELHENIVVFRKD